MKVLKLIVISIMSVCIISCTKTQVNDIELTEVPSAVSASINQDLPIEIKVVVVTMFEIGEDEGDRPGEFQLWKAGQKLDTCLPFPVSHHDICLNTDTGVMGIVTGMGTAKAASAIMALGLDPRFDLRHAYWLVAGIAGFDPNDASIGSGAWASWLVDGDLAHQFDAREIPDSWASGYFPLFGTDPIEKGDTLDLNKLNRHGQSSNGEVYELNGDLADWAYDLTKDTELNDYPEMQTLRETYVDYPNAQKPPFVLKGDQLAASTFWHGKILNEWANTWTHYWTGGKGNFVSSGMEDTGSYQSMIYLDNAGIADKSRFMVLRTASNYSMPPNDTTPLENMKADSGDNGFIGMQSSLETAYLLGSKVVDTIVANWPSFKTNMPYGVDEIVQTKDAVQAVAQEASSLAGGEPLSADQLIASLNLEGHVEGGFYRQTFKANDREMINTPSGERVTMTSIYYLLSAQSPIGHFHLNQSDIMHYFHTGDPITYFMIHPDGALESVILGPDPTQGHQMQMMVKGGVWKASKIDVNGKYSYGLIGEAVSPGFEYVDMSLGKTSELLTLFPQHQALIVEMSREQH